MNSLKFFDFSIFAIWIIENYLTESPILPNYYRFYRPQSREINIFYIFDIRRKWEKNTVYKFEKKKTQKNG
jgi:hypothetical protein